MRNMKIKPQVQNMITVKDSHAISFESKKFNESVSAINIIASDQFFLQH